MLKKETLHKLIERYEGDDLAAFLSGEITHDRHLRKDIKAVDKLIHEAKENCRETCLALETKRTSIQANCPHHESTFHADPAGDTSESFHKCDLCQLEW